MLNLLSLILDSCSIFFFATSSERWPFFQPVGVGSQSYWIQLNMTTCSEHSNENSNVSYVAINMFALILFGHKYTFVIYPFLPQTPIDCGLTTVNGVLEYINIMIESY